jgi:hypothetical protein
MSENESEKEIVVKIKPLKDTYAVPETLKVWTSNKEMSDEYKEMMKTISIMANQICVQLNEGPEVKDSISKRILSLDSIIKILLSRTFLSVYDRVGIINKISFELLATHQLMGFEEQLAKEREKKREYID